MTFDKTHRGCTLFDRSRLIEGERNKLLHLVCIDADGNPLFETDEKLIAKHGKYKVTNLVNDNNLDGTPSTGQKFSTLITCQSGNGNWTVVYLDADKKYSFRNLGVDHLGNLTANWIKLVWGSAAEPDAGGAITWGNASTSTPQTDVELLAPGDSSSPLRGRAYAVAVKAQGEVMLLVKRIERMNSGSEEG